MVLQNENRTNSKFHGFKRGLDHIKMGDYKQAVEDLKRALGINNRNSFYAYRDGKIEPKATQAEAVEGVFNKYGVESANIWGV